MIGKEPPCGGRMLEKPNDEADPVKRQPEPREKAVTNTQAAPEVKPRPARKRRKPFVL